MRYIKQKATNRQKDISGKLWGSTINRTGLDSGMDWN